MAIKTKRETNPQEALSIFKQIESYYKKNNYSFIATDGSKIDNKVGSAIYST